MEPTSCTTFLRQHNMAPEQVDIAQLSQAIQRDMTAALAGKPASTLMLPSYLYADGTPAQHTPVIVLDAGGTNFRTALVTLTESGPQVEQLRECAMPGTAAPVEWPEFIAFCADQIQPLLPLSHTIGICFSYSAAPQPDGDSRVIHLNKEVVIHGGENRPIGGDLQAELARRGISHVKTVVLNDTLAVQFGAAAAHKLPVRDCLGMVCGTGSNICCALPAGQIPKLGKEFSGDLRTMLVNCESGFFTGMAQGTFDRALDDSSQMPGECLLEKMVSGAYLGPLCRLTLQAAAREGLFTSHGQELLLSIDQLSSGEADTLSGPLTALTTADLSLADSIIQGLFRRSAKIVAAALTAVLRLRGSADPCYVGAEGSLFQKSLRFRPALEEFCKASESLRPCPLEFRTCRHATLIGAACAALLMNES